MKIILGTQSVQRKHILEKMGYTFETMSPGIDEKAIRFEDPKQLTLALANTKADALLPRIHEPAILITADLVCVHNGTILEKPENEAEARQFLRGYATAPVKTVGAVVVVNTETKKRCAGIDTAEIRFRPIPETVIDALIVEGNVFSWAGGFAVEDPLLRDYVEHIDGDPDSVMGLPKNLISEFIVEVQNNS